MVSVSLTTNNHVQSCTIIDCMYHELSFTLSMFEFVMIVDDTFSCLAMHAHDSSWWLMMGKEKISSQTITGYHAPFG